MSAGLNVLVVEDDVLLCCGLNAQLAQAGHHVVAIAHSLADVLACPHLDGVDIALVDVNLGEGASGVEVAAWLKMSRNIPAVFLTANPGRVPDDAPGAVGIITKPYSTTGLQKALRFVHSGLVAPPPPMPCPPSLRLTSDFARCWS